VLGCACATGEPARRVPALRYTQEWFTGATTWPSLLARYRRQPNVRYLEVGVFEGRSLFWMLDNVLTGQGSSAVAVDIFAPSYERTFLDNLEASGHKEKVRVVKGRSEDVLRGIPLRSVDIAFIDGSHAARDVLTDAVQSWTLLVDGGLLIFDDYGNDRPRDEFAKLDKVPHELKPRVAVDAFLTAFRAEVEVVERGYQVVLRKRTPPCQDWVCSGGRAWFYHWGQRRLFKRASHEPVPIADEQRSELELLLAETPFGQVEPVPSEACLARPACKSVADLLGAP
jgi:predicted O-methyltransferase YrrM